VGQLTDDDDLKDDWVMTHEMVALPRSHRCQREHHWIEEGNRNLRSNRSLASKRGKFAPQESGGDLIKGLPFGLPQPGDEGLDHTHTWGRTYWGGAMFCLLADVRIRRRNEQ